jgi:hypothetical protein
MAVASNQVRFRCTGREYVLTFDLALLMGDMLEELEEHLGGEAVWSWMQRLENTGIRIRDMRTRDIIAMVFLARAQDQPGVTWSEVAQSIAPFTFTILEDGGPPADEPAPAEKPLQAMAAQRVNPLGIPTVG